MKRIPMCHKCHNAITELNLAYNCYELIGCKKCDDIKNWNDAKELCPVIRQLQEAEEVVKDMIP